jgi:hypothetical protein
MKTRRPILATAVLVLIGGLLVAAQSPPYRVLVVDGTKTLSSTMRVVGLANGIRQSGVAEVTMILAEDLGPFDDPLADLSRPEVPYDLILVVPRGVDDGTATRIWILMPGDPTQDPLSAQALDLLREGIDLTFAGIASAVGPVDDLWAALAASLYRSEGWLR